MDYQEETIEELLVDGLPLMVANNAEVDLFDEPLDLSFSKYLAMNESGNCKCYTIRDNGVLMGYSIFLLFNHLHHSKVLMASQDVVYVAPRARTAGIKLIRFTEKELKKLGVSVISQGAPKISRLAKVLERMGYSESETIYNRRL